MKSNQLIAGVALALALSGCSTAAHPPTTPGAALVATSVAPVPAPVPISTPVAAGVDSRCAHAAISAAQFLGEWTEPDGTEVTNLGDGGALTSSSREQSGAWSYLPWALTPGEPSMPPGQDDVCVLWLHWQTPKPLIDLVYVPLKSTASTLELSFVGRGNTLTWVRP